MDFTMLTSSLVHFPISIHSTLKHTLLENGCLIYQRRLKLKVDLFCSEIIITYQIFIYRKYGFFFYPKRITNCENYMKK